MFTQSTFYGALAQKDDIESELCFLHHNKWL